MSKSSENLPDPVPTTASGAPSWPGETVVEWPHCPECGAPRSTRCPACKHEDSTWEQAYGPSSRQFGADRHAGDAPALRRMAVICPTCDEVFEPVFARRCSDCRHIFADDSATDAARPWSNESDAKRRGDFRHTARTILAALAAAGVLYTLYDWLMSNSGGARLF